MARFKDREKALILRKQGMSYSQIKKALKVSKSTLSGWLNNYPLSKQRIRELRDCNEQRIEKFRETMKRKKDARLKIFYDEQKNFIFPLTKRELYLGGLFLYWGEGTKSHTSNLTISNTDPSVIKFFVKWLVVCLGVPKNKISVQLHLYEDMKIKKEIEFWSEALNIPSAQFTRPYIKKSFLKDINHKGGFGHGTCNVKIGDARLAEKTLMGLKSISDHCLKEAM